MTNPLKFPKFEIKLIKNTPPKRINIIIFSENLIIDEILTQFAEYIKDQVLADSISFTKDSDQFALQLKNSSHHHYFENKVEDINIKIAIF